MVENINETVSEQASIKNTGTYREEVKMSTKSPLPSADQQQKTTQTIFKSFFSSISFLFCCGKFQDSEMETDERVSEAPASRVAASQVANTSEPYETLGYLPEEDNTSENSCHTSIHNGKEIIPLQQFQRYTITPADKQKFKYRRLLYPARTIYEIEWEDNQWLQLDKRTNIYIEQLRVTGFSKMAIRDDTCLRKYISYENPSQMDILLELSITKEDRKKEYKQDKDVKKRSRPIKCHQPSHFSIRRTRWWKTSYEVGEARLPNWVDPDLCCDAVMMDAPSVMAAMTNLSRSSACSLQLPKLPDTPTISQNSSVSQLPYETSSIPTLQVTSWQVKPLKYTDPPVLTNPLVNTVA